MLLKANKLRIIRNKIFKNDKKLNTKYLIEIYKYKKILVRASKKKKKINNNKKVIIHVVWLFQNRIIKNYKININKKESADVSLAGEVKELNVRNQEKINFEIFFEDFTI